MEYTITFTNKKADLRDEKNRVGPLDENGWRRRMGLTYSLMCVRMLRA